jgi:lantibiotic biosynthesis protein
MRPKSEPTVRASGFFVLRTPLLPFRELLDWGSDLELATSPAPGVFEAAVHRDAATVRDRLRAITKRPDVREALFVASPSLDDAITAWLTGSNEGRARDLDLPISRYVQRMSARCTPFGLFAGCSVGTMGERTTLKLPARAECLKHTRLDMDYLFALADALGRDAELRRTLRYRPNSTLYRAAGQLRYAELRLEGGVRTYHLVALTPSDYLEEVLARAKGGAVRAELAQLLVAGDPEEVTVEDAEAFIDELIDTQVLVSDFTPPVTGPEPIHHFIDLAAAHASLSLASAILRDVRDDLAQLDRQPLGGPTDRYRRIAARLEPLPAKAEVARLFQVDLARSTPSAVLGGAVVDELVRGIEIARRLSQPPKEDRLSKFRQSFCERYGERFVALSEVLDLDTGIGFEGSENAENTPLLAGLALGRGAPLPERSPSRRDLWLLRKLFELGPDVVELVLTESDIDELASEVTASLPDAFSVVCAVLASSDADVAEGRFLVRFDGMAGPSGAPMLGRFCHADAELERQVRQHLREEEALRPDAVFAEIAHLPAGRLGNVLCRPVLREHEIAFMGHSGVVEDKLLTIEDLSVSVVRDRIVLFSARLGREVVPRLTNAHAHSTGKNLAIYRFLAALQGEGHLQGWQWDWGLLTRVLPKLPRVRHGRLVLAPARWTLGGPVLKALKAGSLSDHVKTLTEWRAKVGAPRFVAWEDSDNELPIDFHNVLSLEAFAQVAKSRPSCTLVELFHESDEELLAAGPEGRFVHEILVPFTRAGTSRPEPAPPPVASSRRSYAPGGEWLYAKLYTGSATFERVLRDLVRPLVEASTRTGACDRWFFLRYGDPDWHVRLRLRGRPDVIAGKVLPMLHRLAEPIRAAGVLHKVVLDTYDREVERYGGDVGVDLSEQLFHIDSETLLGIFALLGGAEDARWQLAIRGVDQLLDDLGLDFSAKHRLVKEQRATFGLEFRADTTTLKHGLGTKYRASRKTVEAVLDRTRDADGELAPAIALLGKRSERIAPIAAALREAERTGKLTQTISTLAKSFVHMHINRFMRDAARAHELVLFDFLLRHYDSHAARSRSR